MLNQHFSHKFISFTVITHIEFILSTHHITRAPSPHSKARSKLQVLTQQCQCVNVMVEQLVVKVSVSLFTDYSIWAEFLVPNTQGELSNSWRDPSRGTPSGIEYWYVTSQLALRHRRHLSPCFTMWWHTIQIFCVFLASYTCIFFFRWLWNMRHNSNCKRSLSTKQSWHQSHTRNVVTKSMLFQLNVVHKDATVS